MSRHPFEFNDVPIGYLITFRAYGTWLHGDGRGSVDRFHNSYGSPFLPPNPRWLEFNRKNRKLPPVKLGLRQRAAVKVAIRESCQIRNWDLWTLNVRTNHIHTVVTASCKPEVILTAFKANSTRKLRESGYWSSNRSPWAERGSKKYLWTEDALNNAIAYVEYDQGEELL
jgi:REP element-mobilizing transposase RayT